ncbi:MAG: hypothetical protein KatS3mg057_2139 [Herpetosiphonaceae bacterium]|nr:MAG: hypothetical protein KatS3mg057_2139 [Herpetosiphonaceae bacterium]
MLKHVDRAFQGFFRRVAAGQTPGYPRFRGAGWYDNFTYPQYGNGVTFDGHQFTLSNIGTLSLKRHRPIEGTIKTVCS